MSDEFELPDLTILPGERREGKLLIERPLQYILEGNLTKNEIAYLLKVNKRYINLVRKNKKIRRELTLAQKSLSEQYRVTLNSLQYCHYLCAKLKEHGITTHQNFSQWLSSR